jgi:hypothetical protein
LYPLDEVQAGLHNAIEVIIKIGAIPVVIAQSAESTVNSNTCFFRHLRMGQSDRSDCQIDVEDQDLHTKSREIKKIFSELKEKYPTIRQIDIQSIQCLEGKCITEIDGLPLYDDNNHINGYGSAKLGEIYRQRFGTPFSN